MACVFPLSSRESVTFRCTGCATVTFGGGGGCGFGCSLQPGSITRSVDTTIQADVARKRRAFIPLPIRRPGGGLRFTRRRRIVGGRRQQVAPVRASLHLRLDLGRNQILAFTDLPAAPQRAIRPDEARGDAAERGGQAILLTQESLLGGQDRREVRHALAVPENGNGDCALG